MKRSLAVSALSTLAASLKTTTEPWKVNDPWEGLEVMMDGEPLQLYITETWWSEITPLSSSSYDMGWNSRTYLSTTQDWSKDTYFKPNLLGGTMEYDVDLSRVDCGCVAALYVVGMPGIGALGQPFESDDGLHYCDA